jgi:hypothetical protein
MRRELQRDAGIRPRRGLSAPALQSMSGHFISVDSTPRGAVRGAARCKLSVLDLPAGEVVFGMRAVTGLVLMDDDGNISIGQSGACAR